MILFGAGGRATDLRATRHFVFRSRSPFFRLFEFCHPLAALITTKTTEIS